MEHDTRQDQLPTQPRLTDLGRDVDTATRFAEPLVALTALTEATDGLRPQLMTAGREAGMTWEAIGTALGVTRQVARQRFGPAGASIDGRATLEKPTPADSIATASKPGRQSTVEIAARLALGLRLPRRPRPGTTRRSRT